MALSDRAVKHYFRMEQESIGDLVQVLLDRRVIRASPESLEELHFSIGGIQILLLKISTMGLCC